MNYICRIVWSETKACWQVACEADDDASTANSPEDHSASCRGPKQKGCASGAVKARLAFYLLLGFRKHGRCFASRCITSGSGIRSVGVDWRRKSSKMPGRPRLLCLRSPYLPHLSRPRQNPLDPWLPVDRCSSILGSSPAPHVGGFLMHFLHYLSQNK